MEFTVCALTTACITDTEMTDQGIDSEHTASHFLHAISTFALRFHNVLLLIDLLKNRAYSRRKLTVRNAYVTAFMLFKMNC